MKPTDQRPPTEPADRVDFEPPARGPAQSDEDRGTPIEMEASADPESATEEAGYGYGV